MKDINFGKKILTVCQVKYKKILYNSQNLVKGSQKTHLAFPKNYRLKKR